MIPVINSSETTGYNTAFVAFRFLWRNDCFKDAHGKDYPRRRSRCRQLKVPK
jgi:hypothetical protein